MTVDGQLVAGVAMFVGGLAASALLFRLFSQWGEAAALSRARRIAARLREPATSLAEVEDQSAAVEELVQFPAVEAAVVAARELLAERDPTVRSAAIEILRRTRAFDRWVRDLRRGGYGSKLTAIRALGEMADERAMEELIEALGDDDPGVARAASQAVTGRDPDFAADHLAEALASPNRRIAETAAAALVHLGEEAVEALVGQLAHLNPQARRLAVESLGATGASALHELLLPLLETDPDAGVRAAVAEALARLGDNAVFRHIRRLTQSDPDWFVRARSYCLLAEMNAPGAAQFLLDSLAEIAAQAAHGDDSSDSVEVVSDGPPRLRTAIVTGLRMLGFTDDEIRLAERERSPDVDQDLEDGEGDDGAKWSETVAALREPDAAGRAEAARQLGAAGSFATGALRRALRDPEPMVRAEGARSLGRIGASGCLSALAECLLDPDTEVRLAASTAMRAIVTRDAARELSD